MTIWEYFPSLGVHVQKEFFLVIASKLLVKLSRMVEVSKFHFQGLTMKLQYVNSLNFETLIQFPIVTLVNKNCSIEHITIGGGH